MLKRAFTVGRHVIRRYSTENSVKIVSALTTEKKSIDSTELQSLLDQQPALTKYPHTLWQQLQKVLVHDQGFPPNSFVQLVSQQPKLLTLSPSALHKNIEAWRSCQFGERRTQDLLIKYSELILYGDPGHLRHRIAFLQSYVTTSKNVWRLLMSSPDVAFAPELQIKAKFDYLLNVMKVPVPQIIDSDVFVHSLEHLKMRHIFMDRLGLYKKKSKKADEDEKDTNTRLSRIMDSSDKRFATKVCHVTLQEYEVFQELIKREWAREEVTEDDEDYDDIRFHDEADERV